MDNSGLQLNLSVTVDDYERVFSVNVRGVMLCYKHAAKQMLTQGRGGRIIGIHSCSRAVY